jgi:hypothetical protein
MKLASIYVKNAWSFTSTSGVCIYYLVIRHKQSTLCLIKKSPPHEDVAPPILVLSLDRDEWSASLSCRFTPGERALGIHWMGGWVGSRVRPDAMEKR